MNRKTFPRMVIIYIISLVLANDSLSQQTAAKFIQETNYLLALPDGYHDTTRRWPLVIFLHGSGEAGTDLEKVKAHGPPKLIERGKKFPFIVVSPQAPPGTGWETEDLYQLLRHLKNTLRVDDSRIYLTGLSMGGYGTWELAMKHPEEFAAIAPVCGGGDSTDAWKLRNMAVWCFHGAKDDVVYPEQSEQMVNAARHYNKSVRYTLYPNANHNSWDTTYNYDSLYKWMLSKQKYVYKEITSVKPAVLQQYAGIYIGPGNDTVKIIYKSPGLEGYVQRDTIRFRTADENLFFIDPFYPWDLRFTSDSKAVNGFLIFGGRKEVYKRITKK